LEPGTWNLEQIKIKIKIKIKKEEKNNVRR